LLLLCSLFLSVLAFALVHASPQGSLNGIHREGDRCFWDGGVEAGGVESFAEFVMRCPEAVGETGQTGPLSTWKSSGLRGQPATIAGRPKPAGAPARGKDSSYTINQLPEGTPIAVTTYGGGAPIELNTPPVETFNHRARGGQRANRLG